MAAFFDQLAESIRFADVLDVLLLAAFLYALLTWVRRDTQPGTTWRLSFILVFFAGVYLLAGAFSLYLVEQLLEVLVIAFLVASVVLFQSEIRRMIDRVGAFSFRRSSAALGRAEQVLDTITEASRRMAETRTGALIALRGRDAWEGVTEGGVALDGKISAALLDSIFHEETDGHDGAVLVEQDRVVRFGAHLPLASDLPEASQAGGTRHAAGLGLAEQCDAFVVIVSEERGTISVAEGGRLEEVETAGLLRERLGRFWERHYGDATRRERWWSRGSVQTAFLALLMSCLFWFSFAYDPGTTYRRFEAPVAFRNMEPTWAISETEPSEVSISLAGPERAFRLIEPSELAVSFPLSELEEGANQLNVTEEHLNLPDGIRLQEATPSDVQVTAWRLRTARVPVRAQSRTGPLPDSLRLRTTPDTVRLMVPRENETDPTEIVTEALSLDSLRAASGPLQADLLPPERTRLPEDQPRSVEVRLERAGPNDTGPNDTGDDSE